MRRIQAGLAVLIVAAAFPSGGSMGRSAWRSTGDDQKRAEARAENELLGTWKLVEAKYGSTAYKVPEGTTELKHVTAVHWVLTVFDKDGKVGVVMGGPYAMNGDKYEETPEYGITEIFTNIKGKPQTFTWKVEGNKWFHNGTISSGLTIEEVWQRVDSI